MRIYENIAQICAEEGRSVASVEKEAHFALGTIRRWGNVMPSIDKMVKVAGILGVSVDKLCGIEYEYDDDDDDSPLVTNFIKEQQNQSPDEGMLIQAYRLIPSEHRMEALEAVFKVKQKYEK